jgi:hypothetical protein
MTTFTAEARRSFIKNTIGIIGLAIIPKVNLFAEKSISNLKIGSIGIDSQKNDLLSSAFKKSNLNLSFSTINQKSDILFLGNIDKISIAEIGKLTSNHSMLIIEKSNSEAKLFEIKSYCHYKAIHFAEIERWADGSVEGKVFEKLSFHEISIDESKIHQSIQYLAILSKLTVGNGFKIII